MEVVWDGTRVYRVPTPGEVEAVRLLGEGHHTHKVSQMLGLKYAEGALARSKDAQAKLHAFTTADCLYHLYRLQILPSPHDRQLQPVLDPFQREILDLVVRLGVAYSQAHKNLRMGYNQLVRRVREIGEALGADTRPHMLKRAVELGDIKVQSPPQLWAGVV